MTDQPTCLTEPPDVPGYRLGEVAGRGASSVVWFAEAEGGGDLVVVKVSASPGTREDALAMAVRERAILERVTGEHIVRLHDVVPLGGDTVAVVLDAAGGGSLHDLVSARGALHPGEVVTIFTPVAAAVAELHAAGVVHADLSPGNVLFTGDGKPMLGDLGVSRLVGEQHPVVVAGTPGFVAPEVSCGGLPTEAGDVWSLAALIWYAVTGGSLPPHEKADVAAPGAVGPVFADVLVPMLASDAAQRPAAADLPARIYRSFPAAPIQLAGRQVDPAVALTRRIRHEAALERVAAAPEAAARTRRRRGLRWSTSRWAVAGGTGRRTARTAALGAVLLLLLTAVVAAAAVTTWHERPASSTPSEPLGRSARDGAPATHPVAPQEAMADPAVPDPTALLQALAEVRARALTEADVGLLRGALLDGSPAHAADVRTLEALQSAGLRWADLGVTVRSAVLLSATGTSARVRAVVDQGPYVVLGPDAARTQMGGAAGSELTYALELTEAGWRISDVSPG